MRNANVILLASGVLLLPGCYGNKTLRQPITIEEIATDVQEIRGNQVTLSAEMGKLEEQLAAQAESLEKLRVENQTLYEQLGDRLSAIDNKLKEAIGRSSAYSTAKPYWSGDGNSGNSSSSTGTSGNGNDGSSGTGPDGGVNAEGSTTDRYSDGNANSSDDRPRGDYREGGAESADGSGGSANESTQDTAPESTGAEASNGKATPNDVSGLPPEAQAKTIYEQAYLDLTRGNYSLAILGFVEFLRRSPASDLADNAQYWIGESYYAQKDYRQAILEFQKVVDHYSSGDKVPSALLKVGFSQISIGDNEAARATLTDVTRRFPDSEESRLARDKLRTLD